MFKPKFAIMAAVLTAMFLPGVLADSYGADAGPAATSRPSTEGWHEDAPAEIRKYWNSIESTPAPSLMGLTYSDVPDEARKRMEDHVVVLAFWSSTLESSVKEMNALATAAADFPDDAVVLAVHTPSGWGGMKKVADAQHWPFILAADVKSELSVKLRPGKPVRLYVIDKAGKLRVAGASAKALPQIVKAIANEGSSAAKSDDQVPNGFPAFNKGKLSANDLQGKPAPNFDALDWISAKPNSHGKIVLVDLWATWCGPCRSLIPELNRRQKEFGNDLAVIGISDEKPEKIKEFMADTKMSYSVACDSKRVFNSAVRNHYIPHVFVCSTDGIVRWQGSAWELTDSMIKQLIENDPGVQARRKNDADAKAGN